MRLFAFHSLYLPTTWSSRIADRGLKLSDHRRGRIQLCEASIQRLEQLTPGRIGEGLLDVCHEGADRPERGLVREREAALPHQRAL